LLISHNPNVRSSVKALEHLEAARTQSYPKSTRKRVFPPLSFDIDIRERSPTAEEFTELIYMAETSTYTLFLDRGISHSFRSHPTNAQGLYDIVQKDLTAMRWPILVNYNTQQIALDHTSLKSVLKTLVHERDGKPKEPEPPAPHWTLPPKPEAWTDYD
jgi:arsenate reductase-like glutaredoxin family protein